jgi:hypothetical protein
MPTDEERREYPHTSGKRSYEEPGKIQLESRLQAESSSDSPTDTEVGSMEDHLARSMNRMRIGLRSRVNVRLVCSCRCRRTETSS